MNEDEQLQPTKLTAEDIARICRVNVQAIMGLNSLIVESLKHPEEALLFLAEQDRQIRLLSEALCRLA